MGHIVTDIFVAIYLALAMIFLLPTLNEGAQKSAKWDAFRVMGVFACLAWPVTMLFVFAAVRKRRALI